MGLSSIGTDLRINSSEISTYCRTTAWSSVKSTSCNVVDESCVDKSDVLATLDVGQVGGNLVMNEIGAERQVADPDPDHGHAELSSVRISTRLRSYHLLNKGPGFDVVTALERLVARRVRLVVLLKPLDLDPA